MTRRLLLCLRDAIHRAEDQDWREVRFMGRRLGWDYVNSLEARLELRAGRQP